MKKWLTVTLIVGMLVFLFPKVMMQTGFGVSLKYHKCFGFSFSVETKGSGADLPGAQYCIGVPYDKY